MSRSRRLARKTETWSRRTKGTTASASGEENDLATKTDVGTFESWIDKQRDYGLEKGRFRSATEGSLPFGSTEDWLKKQKAPEQVESREEETTLPLDTTEAWLRRQITELTTKEKSQETGETSPVPQNPVSA
jgi:hypothetical protein